MGCKQTMESLHLFVGVGFVDHILPSGEVLVIAYGAEEFLHVAGRLVDVDDSGLGPFLATPYVHGFARDENAFAG